MESAYEKLRRNNIEENKKILRELGLLAEHERKIYRVVQKRWKDSVNRTGSVKRTKTVDLAVDVLENYGSVRATGTTPRRSSRLLGREPSENPVLESDEEEEKTPAVVRSKKENVFGSIEGIEIGTSFETRLESSRAGIHRPTVAGIHGNELEGCYSIALSGGYEDDVDLGEVFTYTGEGGRDLKGTKANPKNLRTAPQSKDQVLTKGNLALTKNIENRRPVRVIRGFKLNSPYAPESGYRYDGLYNVEKYWMAKGKSGFLVYKYVLNRCKDQETTPWHCQTENCMTNKDSEMIDEEDMEIVRGESLENQSANKENESPEESEEDEEDMLSLGQNRDLKKEST